MKRSEIKEFFESQLLQWADCAKRYADLEEARSKTVDIEGREYQLMFNPARMRSATAKVSGGKVDRPCFLCRDNRPVEQKDIRLNCEDRSYLLSVNPFPILPEHFTIINDGHCRQEMNESRLADMAFMAREMEGYLVFFNGACSGASAPDHFHFQAVPQELVPLVNWNENTKRLLGVQYAEPEKVKIVFENSDNCNILCWNTPQGLCWWVVNRRQHRPWQYSAEGDEKVLISPASLEFAGVVPLAREEDFDKMDCALLDDIYGQCWDREPLVDVGIGPMPANLPLRYANQNGVDTFEVKDVRIGIGFHWDQKRTFRYEGKALFRSNPENGENWLINRLPVEKYLKSVISSEMSATSSLQLLKAHAVISRSWLLRQIANRDVKPVHHSSLSHSSLKWYDSSSHTFFDVCADDHCQRYQGVSDKMNPVVEQAIEETRGEVLMYDGAICDARFSKCCGGMTEEFRYCWDNVDYPYLQAIRDARVDGSDFCNTSNKEILSQVLNDYDQETHDFYEWEVKYSVDELSDLIERKLHLGFGRIIDLVPVERGKSGRVSQLKVVGENKTLIIGKELEIRRALSETHLYSSNFEVTKTLDSSLLTFSLKGKGWGHGVGLCQIGAAVMGAEGYDYKEILEHYYINAEIKKIW